MFIKKCHSDVYTSSYFTHPYYSTFSCCSIYISSWFLHINHLSFDISHAQLIIAPTMCKFFNHVLLLMCKTRINFTCRNSDDIYMISQRLYLNSEVYRPFIIIGKLAHLFKYSTWLYSPFVDLPLANLATILWIFFCNFCVQIWAQYILCVLCKAIYNAH